MEPNDPAFVATPPGGGPRHVTFHTNGKWMYSNNEMTSSVTAFELNAATGAAKMMQTISTLPSETAAENSTANSTAEILVHPTGRFLYCSNRGHNSIASFSIDQETGRLTATGHTSSGGRILAILASRPMAASSSLPIKPATTSPF